MQISKSTAIFLSIIFITGILTIITDLRIKRIYNKHLVIGLLLGLLASFYATIWTHEDIIYHIVSGIIGFITGLCLYRFGVWKGGDAKLFALYAFLMPPINSNVTLFSNVISLFSCSFIIGMLIILPIFIKDILINRKELATELFSAEKSPALIIAVIRTIFFSWMLFPFYYVVSGINPSITLIVTYVIFRMGYSSKSSFKYLLLEIPGSLIFGVLMRFWLRPESLLPLALAHYLIVITLSTTFSICIYTTMNFLKDYRDRVSFAPLLFAGCILSYTPFLKGIMGVMIKCNALLYR